MDLNGGTFKLVNGTFTGDTATLASVMSENGGAFEWWGGTLNGTLRINAGAAFNVSGTGLKQIGNGAILNNAGSINWSGGNIYNTAYNLGTQATINNLAGGVFDTAGDVGLTHDYNASTFNNNAGATFRKSAGTTTTCDWYFNNSGTIDLQTGSFANNALTLASNSIVNVALATQTNSAQLTENGAIAFGGALNVLANGVPLTNGLSFTLANYSSETGAFTPVTLPALPTKWRWKVAYGPTALTVAIVNSTVLSAPVASGNGQLQLNLTGESASAAILQTSLNLTNWTSLYTNAPFTGAFDFNDTPSPTETNKFDRILIVP
jgi:hypothetical protein